MRTRWALRWCAAVLLVGAVAAACDDDGPDAATPAGAGGAAAAGEAFADDLAPDRRAAVDANAARPRIRSRDA